MGSLVSDDVGGPTVSLAEAGAQSHMSVATIRRRLKADKIPGAVRNDYRSWSIPVASLVAEGIWSGTTADIAIERLREIPADRDFGLEEFEGKPSPKPELPPPDGHKILRTLAAVVAASALVFSCVQQTRQADALCPYSDSFFECRP